LHRSLKRNLVVALAALAAAAFAGGAYAATQSSGPATRQAFLNDVAKRLHVTPSQLSAALNGASVDQLQAQVKAGRITQAQANALEQRLKNGGSLPLVPFAVPRAFPAVPGPWGGPGGALPRKAFPKGAPVPQAVPRPFGLGGPAFGLSLNAASSYLGLTDAQLIKQLQSGKSLAQVATSKGKTVAGLEQAMTAQVKKTLDAAVSAKGLTAAQAKQLLSRYESSLTQRINQKGLTAPLPRAYFRGQGPNGTRIPRPAWPAPGAKGPYGRGFAPPPANAPKGSKTPGSLPPQLFLPAPTA